MQNCEYESEEWQAEYDHILQLLHDGGIVLKRHDGDRRVCPCEPRKQPKRLSEILQHAKALTEYA